VILRVRVELINDSEEGAAPALGYWREEVAYWDVPADAAEGSDAALDQALAKAVVEEGATLLDWLNEAQRRIGAQVDRLSRGLEA
jgi:hypothetical protein